MRGAPAGNLRRFCSWIPKSSHDIPRASGSWFVLERIMFLLQDSGRFYPILIYDYFSSYMA